MTNMENLICYLAKLGLITLLFNWMARYSTKRSCASTTFLIRTTAFLYAPCQFGGLYYSSASLLLAAMGVIVIQASVFISSVGADAVVNTLHAPGSFPKANTENEALKQISEIKRLGNTKEVIKRARSYARSGVLSPKTADMIIGYCS